VGAWESAGATAMQVSVVHKANNTASRLNAPVISTILLLSRQRQPNLNEPKAGNQYVRYHFPFQVPLQVDY
jgi:hypothetical protein